jgi:hypothetical protein
MCSPLGRNDEWTEMADEASDTLGGGLRAFLWALASAAALIGLEEVVRGLIRERGSWGGAILIAIALLIFFSPTAWRWMRSSRWMGYAKGKAGAELLA